jgi:hypothetical protein
MKVTLDTKDKPERKKRPPRTAFKPGNPYAFRPGESGRSRAKTPTAPDDVRLVSKALRARLPFRAPDAIALKLGLEPGASWAQCIAQSLIYTAVRGDVAGIRAIHELTEGMLHQRFGIGLDHVDEDGGGGPRLVVQFVSSRYENDASPRPKFFETDLEGVTKVYEGDRLVETRAPQTLSAPKEPSPDAAAEQPAPERKAVTPKPGNGAAQPAPFKVPDSWRA